MYELYIVTKHTSWDWWDSLLPQFNTTNNDFLAWQRQITESSTAKSYNFSINGLTNGVAIDRWTFLTKEDLIEFYNNYSSNDSTVNYNRAYPWNVMMDLINQAGVSIRIYSIDPNGIEEVIYDNQSLLG